MAAFVVFAAAALLTPCGAMENEVYKAGHNSKRKALRPAEKLDAPIDKSVVQPLRFHQELLVCNAYPSESHMVVKQNGESLLNHEQNGLAYRDCKELTANVQQKDKLDFTIEGLGIQGTFEVGELPNTDATLLLVVEKRDAKTPLVAFQSFSFPVRAAGTVAQLAVIDTYKGTSTMPHLKMEDHIIASKEKRAVSKRSEQLNFNRIYAIEEGTYDASISDHIPDATAKSVGLVEEQVSAKKVLHLTKSQNYIVMRTGDDKQFPQSLVVFPPELKSGAMTATPMCFALLSVVLAVFVF